MSAWMCPLASGSLGNALLVASARARLLIDLGLSRRCLKAHLAALGVQGDEIDAVLLTHTHGDHFSSSAAGFCRTYGVKVHSSGENLSYLADRLPGFRKLVKSGLAEPLDGESLRIGDVTAEAFAVPHDSPGGCLGFRLSMGPSRRRRVVTVATDLGHVPDACLPRFIDADVVVLESNHDPDLLYASGRPWDLIDRIAGPEGHLSNEAAADAFARVAGRSRTGRVKHLVLAHLSRDCNRPELALAAQAHLARGKTESVRVFAASQFAPGPRVEL